MGGQGTDQCFAQAAAYPPPSYAIGGDGGGSSGGNGGVLYGGGGGGGGSGFIDSSATSASFHSGVQASNGSVIITYTLADTTAPTALVDTHPATPTKATSASYTFHATDPDDTSGFVFGCSLDGAAFSPCSSPANYPNLANGSHTFKVHASDSAGNQGSDASFTWLIDTIAPTARPTQSPAPNTAGWNNSDVTVAWTWSDDQGGSGLDSPTCTTSSTSSGEGTLTLNATCTDLAGNQGSGTDTVKVDKTPPTIVAAAASVSNASGWYNANVPVHFTCTDAPANVASGIASCPPDQMLSTEGSSVSSTAQSATDVAGNTSQKSNVVTVAIDKTPPMVSVTGVSSGTSYGLGTVPTPGCSTTDPLSGVATSASLQVSNGTSSGVGTFTATCSGAADKAGNTAPPVSATYTVSYTFSGFLPPINNAPTVNTGKAGRTYPVKFQLSDGNGHYISSLSAVKSITYQSTSCSAFTGDPTDALETDATGGTSLRYDTTANQFVYNWATPGAGCYTLFLTLDSGQVFPAFFQLS
jgi:hypothetical protein